MMKETLSGTILSINFHLTLSTQQHQILPLPLIIYFSEKREEIAEDVPAPTEGIPAPASPTPAPTLETVENDHTLQEQESQHARTLGSQPAHIVTFTCKMLSQPKLVDTQYNVGLYEQL